MYYNQNDYPHIPYPAPGYESATVKSGGCGPTAMAMALEDLTGDKHTPPEVAATAIKTGARVSGGTDIKRLAKAYNIPCTTTNQAADVLAALGRGVRVIANVGGKHSAAGGLFSSDGHFIYLRSAEGTRVTIWDSGYYAGKYNTTARKAKVHVQYPDLYANMVDVDRDCSNRSPRYYILEGNMNITESTVAIGDTKVPSLLKDGKNYVELRPMLDAVNKHTCLTATWSEATGAKVEVGE